MWLKYNYFDFLLFYLFHDITLFQPQEKVKEMQKFDYRNFKDSNLKRMFKKLAKLNYDILPDDKYRKLMDAITAMQSNYGKIRICSYSNRTKCDLQLEPG